MHAIILQAQIITTVAGPGAGAGAYSGDGGLAINAGLGDLGFVYPAFDNAGNMYFATDFNNTIRKIDNAGIITTIAGKFNVMGTSGDGGPAINALLYHPSAIAIDKNNNIYFVDNVNDLIRKIDATGIITTVTGNPINSCGVGIGGPLQQARFWAISALVFDVLDNLYVSEYACDVILKVDNAGIINRVAGNNTYGFSGDGGAATSAQFAYPCKIAIDAAGNLYIPDAQNHRIRKVTPGGIITTIAGTGVQGYSGDGGPATQAKLSFPGSVVIDKAGNLYFGDYNNVIRKIDAAGIISTYAGNGSWGYTGDGGPASLASLTLTEGRISIDANDNIYFCDPSHGVIRKISNCMTASIITHPVNDSLCTSGNVFFSVTSTNATSLQWQVNTGTGWTDLNNNGFYAGSNTGTLQVTGADISMNNYQYRCKVANGCGTIYSSAATLKVTAPANPQITISSPSTNICSGSILTFTAVAVNGGVSPVFQWKKNGSNAGTNSTTYTENSFVNGDIISCVLTSNNTCITTPSATSNAIPLTVSPLLVPSVSINASANNTCSGTGIVFTAVPVNGGTTPVYQWKKNGINTGTNVSTYTDNALNNGDIITCVLTSNEVCKTTATAQSNSIVMNIIPLVTPVITINASKTTACAGTAVTFTATVTGGGVSPIYQWKKNGINIGSHTSVYQDNNLKSGDIVSCALTSNSNCVAVATVNSNPVSVTVLNAPAVNLDKATALCTGNSKLLDAGNYISWLWNDGSTSRSLTVNKPGTYSVTVTDLNGCKGFDTARITTLLPLPANFLPIDTSVCIYDKLTLSAKSAYSSYLWNNNTGGTAITVSTPGLYWLEVKDQFNCIGRDSVLVKPKDCLTGLYVPNAFTPNNDHLNDVIHPFIGGNVVLYEFSIFNRWVQWFFLQKRSAKDGMED